MNMINIHEAKTHLSRYIDVVERGIEAEIVIARNGKPAVRLVPIAHRKPVIFGTAKGKYVIPDNIDGLNPEIERLFYGNDD